MELPPLIRVISFGYLHSPPPAEAHMVIDLRHHFRDPHFDPQLRHLTSSDLRVRAKVLDTPGIRELVEAIITASVAMISGPARADVVVAVGCAGGRHRAPTVARAVVERLEEMGHDAQLDARHTTKPVVERP